MNIARFSVNTAIASALGLAMISALTPAAYADQPEIGTVENLTSDYPTVGIVQDMVAGDRACYVDVIDPNGNISTQFADFEICEQDLIDQVVELTYESGNIVAESCNGNIECGLSDTVMLITKAVVLSF